MLLDSNSLVTRAVADCAGLQGDKIALIAAGEIVTFEQLEARGAQLANFLRSLGVGTDEVIGVCLERSPEFVVAALAIMKAGAAYLPMDPGYPVERLRFIAKDAGVRIVVTSNEFAERFAGVELNVVSLDGQQEIISRHSTETPHVHVTGDRLAYVIYTSGSTGHPKGVEVTHRNLTHLIRWHLRAFALNPAARATFLAGVGFDAAVWEIWPALAAGATLYLPPDCVRMSPDALRDYLVANEITIAFAPTVIAEQLLTLPWPEATALRYLLTGADTLGRYPAPGLPFTFVNNYGPTECTVVATSGIVPTSGDQEGAPTIGLPIDGAVIHIADAEMRTVGDGDEGEIYIGGAGVARGYRNRAELTAERFVPNLFDQNGARVYRTGDLARRLPSGEIAFLGRADDQVKIRGFRVELGEINAALTGHPSIGASIVVAREDVPGEKRLVAYVVGTAGAVQDELQLRDSLRQRLPDYMQPAAFVWLQALPLTINGKVDRSALPIPNVENLSRDGDFTAPSSAVEEALAEIVCEVLKLPRVSVHDDFFHLGAHSLLGAQIIARVRGAFGAELKLLDVFDSPTVSELSVKIEESLTRQLNAMSDAEVEAALTVA